jgi:hypothetical protein
MGSASVVGFQFPLPLNWQLRLWCLLLLLRFCASSATEHRFSHKPMARLIRDMLLLLLMLKAPSWSLPAAMGLAGAFPGNLWAARQAPTSLPLEGFLLGMLPATLALPPYPPLAWLVLLVLGSGPDGRATLQNLLWGLAALVAPVPIAWLLFLAASLLRNARPPGPGFLEGLFDRFVLTGLLWLPFSLYRALELILLEGVWYLPFLLRKIRKRQ